MIGLFTWVKGGALWGPSIATTRELEAVSRPARNTPARKMAAMTRLSGHHDIVRTSYLSRGCRMTRPRAPDPWTGRSGGRRWPGRSASLPASSPGTWTRPPWPAWPGSCPGPAGSRWSWSLELWKVYSYFLTKKPGDGDRDHEGQVGLGGA